MAIVIRRNLNPSSPDSSGELHRERGDVAAIKSCTVGHDLLAGKSFPLKAIYN
ncbi:MAG: hypothetical protein ABGW84_12865 [Sphingomonadaceae bacterium]